MGKLASRLHLPTYFLLTGIVIFFNQRLNFDMHHDGLITTNFQEIRFSIENGGFWPFNQYGVTWVIPYLPIILVGDPNSIYARANTTSLLIFALTLFISFITARKFLGAKKAIFVPLAIAATASLGNLKTWPSVSAMLYLSCFSLAAVKYFYKQEPLSSVKRAAFYMGLLIPLIMFSRVQVGIFLFVAFSIFVFRFGRSKTRTYFFLTITLTASILAFVLASRNWLGSVLRDTFIYSLNYLTKDETKVVPIYTVIGSLFVLTLFSALLSDKTSISSGRLLSIFVACGLLFLLVLYVRASLTDEPDSTGLYRILVSRLFVSTLIGTFLYFLINQIQRQFRKRRESDTVQDLSSTALLLVATASLLQLVPLFSSTHAWWASPPLVIMLSLLINHVILKYFESVRFEMVLKPTVFMLLSLLLFSAQAYNLEKSRLTSFGPDFVFGARSTQLEVAEQNQLLKMVSSAAPSNSNILNLCINSNIFLIAKNYRSASRFYVSWPNMSGYSEFIDATKSSEPDFILLCSELLMPPVGNLNEKDRSKLQVSQKTIIQQTFPQPYLVNHFISARDVRWELWSNKGGA